VVEETVVGNGEGEGEGEADAAGGGGSGDGGPVAGAGTELSSGDSAMLQEEQGDDESSLSTGTVIGASVGLLMCLVAVCAFLVGRRSARRRESRTMATQLSNPTAVAAPTLTTGMVRSRSGSRRAKGSSHATTTAQTYGQLTMGSESTYGTVSLARGDGEYRAMPSDGGSEYRSMPAGGEAGGEYRAVPVAHQGGNYRAMPVVEQGGNYRALPTQGTPSVYSPVATASVASTDSDTLYAPPPPPFRP